MSQILATITVTIFIQFGFITFDNSDGDNEK